MEKENRQGRRNRGAVGATCPHNFEAVGALPPNFELSISFIFFHLNLGLSPKIVDKIREFLILGRSYLGPRETFAPPNFKVVPSPLRIGETRTSSLSLYW